MSFSKIIAVIIVANLFSACLGIACTPYLCEGACSNSPTAESCEQRNQEYRPNATFCGCCALCVDYIPIGGSCGLKLEGTPIFLGLRPPIEKHCAPGSCCIENICVKKDN